MTHNPLVTVICICHNHAVYVQEALDSVCNQLYKELEVIVVDDASSDGSRAVIEQTLKDFPLPAKIIFFETNTGNCRAFNAALEMASGKYIIDLAADDVLLPNRIAEDVACFESKTPEAGAVFSNLMFVNPAGKPLKPHFPTDAAGKSVREIPSGDVYTQVLAHYFISPPAVTFNARVLKEVGGYDAGLSYEDFDIHLRIARRYPIYYIDKILTHKRVLENSHGARYFFKNNPHAASTLLVLTKAAEINRTPEDKIAWKKRLVYEMKIALLTQNFNVVRGYSNLYARSGAGFSVPVMLFGLMAFFRLPLYPLYRRWMMLSKR